MGQAIGDSILFAVGLAVSTLPIVAIIFMLLAGGSRARSLAFAAGWIVGTAAAVTVVIAASDLIGTGSTESPDRWVSVVKILLGAALLALAVVDWRKRPAPGAPAPAPRWMRSLEGFTPRRCAGVGALVAAVNPKNLVMVLGGGLAIAEAPASVAGEVVAACVFVVVGTSPAIGLVVMSEAFGPRSRRALASLSSWLQRHNAAVMAGLFLVIGTVLVVKGVGGL